MVTCGIDWAQDHHDIAIVDTDGRLVAKRRIPESVAGFTELTAMLADAGVDPKDPIPGRDRDPARLAGRGVARPAVDRSTRSTRCRWPATGSGRRCRARSPTTPMPSRWPTFCVPTPISIAGCPPTRNWRNRSPCSPGRIRTPPGAQPGRQRTAVAAARILPGFPAHLR